MWQTEGFNNKSAIPPDKPPGQGFEDNVLKSPLRGNTNNVHDTWWSSHTYESHGEKKYFCHVLKICGVK